MKRFEIAAWFAGIAGFLAIVVGFAMIYRPAGLIVGGAMLLAWSWLADRAAAIADRKPE
ncbi:hypothetical protein [Paraburkholderia sacchari]|uniref:hypothetical protein n=1 Tax=Paraburkholderia sacchari TaxID=159450 RepID=UPI001BCBB4C2|nr:hypothetical protein [Paraburkholderia sacchari]